MIRGVRSTLLIASCFCFASADVSAKDPDCSNRDAWPSGMAFTYLKNAGVFQASEIDSAQTSVVRLASERIGRGIYRQVHLIRFEKSSGEQIEAITVNEVSRQECSMSGADVYLISKRFGDYSRKK